MIYLYVKTHNITGLKYFGKTTRKDPYKYKGSGIYWLKHLRKHGSNFTTEIIGTFDNEEACTKVALAFSAIYNIAHSKEWANLKEENGLDGSPKGVVFTDEHKDKIRQSRYGKCYNDFDSDTRKKMSESAKRRTEEQKKQGTHTFSGVRGSELASKRNKKLLESGKHNFVNFVIVVDTDGDRSTITREQFWAQSGPKECWIYVQHTSKEAKKRLMTAKDIK